MKKYWIKDSDGYYWCKRKMKPSYTEDIPRNYSVQGYWSNFTENYDIERRVKYYWVFAQLEKLMMKLLGNMKSELEEI